MSVDVVCILDADLAQVLETARPVKAIVKEEAKVMDHPLETGASVVDHRVILPVVIELSMILTGEEYAATYQSARELFYAGTVLTVQTRTGSYPSMVISSMPHEEAPEVLDGTNLALTLTEAQFVSAQFSDAKVAHASDSRTVKRGEQQPQEAPQRKGSVLSGIFK